MNSVLNSWASKKAKSQMEKERIVITHRWDGLDGMVLNRAASMFSDKLIYLEDIAGYCKKNKYFLIFLAIVLYVRAYVTRMPKALIWEGVNIGSGVVNLLVRTSEYGKFNFNFNYLKNIYAALRCLYGAQVVIKSKNVLFVLGADEVYYLFNVVAQVADKVDIHSLVIQGGSSIIVQRFSSRKLTGHTKFEIYPLVSCSTSEKEKKQAITLLDSVINGASSYDYMPRARNNVPRKPNPICTNGDSGSHPVHIIFLHDFFDAVSIYGESIFNDHYEWCSYLISYLLNKNCKIIVKVHPNGRPGNDVAVKKIMAHYGLRIQLVYDTSLLQLSSLNVACIYTVYGSVILEAARLGYTVICSGRNPCVGFPVAMHPKTKAELNKAIDWVIQGGRLAICQDDVANAYYAHYIYDWGNKFPVPMSDLAECDWVICFPGTPYPLHNYNRPTPVKYSRCAQELAMRKFEQCHQEILECMIRIIGN